MHGSLHLILSVHIIRLGATSGQHRGGRAPRRGGAHVRNDETRQGRDRPFQYFTSETQTGAGGAGTLYDARIRI